jgi:hypothetical protein
MISYPERLGQGSTLLCSLAGIVMGARSGEHYKMPSASLILLFVDTKNIVYFS